MKRIVKVDELGKLVLGEQVTKFDHELFDESCLVDLLEKGLFEHAFESYFFDVVGEETAVANPDFDTLASFIDRRKFFNEQIAPNYIVVLKDNGRVACLID